MSTPVVPSPPPLARARWWGLGALAVPALLAGACVAGHDAARVVSIADGDTIRVKRGSALISVRLACIDAPEMAQRPHGGQARRALQRRLPPGSPVRLEEKDRDRYGRLVAEVFAQENINLALVADGQAFVYRRHLGQCDGQAYRAAESRAQVDRLGVWQVPGGITRPWNFRRK
ncbi:thermonuclease family protein [Cyanobium sp. CH-040]|uniref:thermonuclease family protein n=1 Tax=Cyanobium sp. CH-040 TaxID=2823708 RepID=UPI0020CEDCEA|nr:thermonuclease family protein [Cyanobium sp. CH-040]MCP9928453.1 thermonuclease family protein [Cyanobium sp. CH-040]